MNKKYIGDYENWLVYEKELNEEGLKKTSPKVVKIYRSEETWDESTSGYLYRPGRKLFLPKSQWKFWRTHAINFYMIGEQRLYRDPQTRILYVETWNGKKFVREGDGNDQK